MPKHTSPGLRYGLIAAVAALLPLTEAAATGGGGGVSVPTSVGNPPLRSCTFPTTYPTGSVQIIAGPLNAAVGDTTLAPNFPVKVIDSVNCPTAQGQQCLRWDYKWIHTGVIPSYSFVTLDSDLILLNAIGGSSPRVNAPITGDPTGVGGGVAEARVVRFNAYGYPTFNAALFTPLDARVGKVTTGFLSGLKKGFCGIQGAENAAGSEFFASQSKTITTNTLGCTVDWTLSPDGCVTNAVLNPLSQSGAPQFCSIANQTISGTAGPVVGATCGAEISVPGSTTTCRWNSIARTNICVTVP